MTNKDIEQLAVHPLIASQEKTGEKAAEFRGFVGTKDDVLRLYADLGMSSYVDIPKDAVVHVEKDVGGVPGQVSVFVSHGSKVTEVAKRTLSAEASAFSSTLSARASSEQLKWFPISPKRPWDWCYEECEAAFARQAAEVLALKNHAAIMARRFGANSPEYQEANTQAIEAENRAVGMLHECITQCQAKHPLSRIFSGSVEEIVARLSDKYLGKGG